VTRLALRNTFRNVAPAVTRKIVGGNLIDLYGLDRSRLESIATRIGALTPAEITEPVTEIPAGASKHAFRTTEVWT
jgi:hypothetical protein